MSSKVLIADDAAFIREVLSSLLSSLGYQVIGEAKNGTEALQMTLSLKPDFLILDLVMPEKNGIEVAQELTAQNSFTKIIACSSESEQFLRDQVYMAGCVTFLLKPFNRTTLVKALKEASSSMKEVANG